MIKEAVKLASDVIAWEDDVNPFMGMLEVDKFDLIATYADDIVNNHGSLTIDDITFMISEIDNEPEIIEDGNDLISRIKAFCA